MRVVVAIVGVLIHFVGVMPALGVFFLDGSKLVLGVGVAEGGAVRDIAKYIFLVDEAGLDL